MPSLSGLGQHYVDAAPVTFAAAPFDQAMPGQAIDQPGQSALAQVDGFGQVLGAELPLLALGQPLEDFEVAHAEPVPLGGVVSSPGLLIAARFVKGAAAAFTAPASMSLLTTTFPEGSLLGRFGPTPLTGLAFTFLVLAYAVFLRAGVHPDYPAVMLPATLLVGLAFGLGFSSLTVAATAGVPDSEQGLAASLFQTSFQVGGAVVLAIVTAVVDAGGAGQLVSPSATLAAYRPALVLITGIAAIGMLIALSGLRSRPARVSGERRDGHGAGDLVDELAAGELAAGDLVGSPALRQAADVAGGSTEA